MAVLPPPPELRSAGALSEGEGGRGGEAAVLPYTAHIIFAPTMMTILLMTSATIAPTM